MRYTFAILAAITLAAFIVALRPQSPFGAQAALTVDDIAALQESYKEKNGHYLQVLPDNKLPHDDSGTVSQKLGVTLPTQVRINTYISPKGTGYQIVTETATSVTGVAYGPEAAERTYFEEKPPAPHPFVSSTTTKP